MIFISVIMNDYGLRYVLRRSGKEIFQQDNLPIGIKLLDFWQWSSSDLLTNTLRGRLAEFIVASALDVASGTRVEWDAIDVISSTGVKVEVKSSAYLQSWIGTPTRITFDIQHKRAWDWDANSFAANPLRTADVYVFCLLDHKDPETVDPTNLDQWRFFVVATKVLEARLGQQKSLSLTTLQTLNVKGVKYSDIAEAVELAVRVA